MNSQQNGLHNQRFVILHTVPRSKNKTDVFNVDWLYTTIFNETIEAEIEVFKLRNATEKLFSRVEEEPRNQQKRTSPLL